MKKSTKLILGLTAMTTLGLSASAQLKECDLALSIVSPADYSTIPFGDTVYVEVEVKNNGKDAISATDTLFFESEGATRPFWIVTEGIAAGGTSHPLQVPYRFVNNMENRMEMTLCIVLIAQKDATYPVDDPNGVDTAMVSPIVTYNDLDSTNNFDCVTFVMSPKPTSAVQDVIVKEKVGIYPNPATSIINLNMVLAQPENVIATVSDITGRTVLRKNFGKIQAGSATPFTINTAGLNTGLYFVELVAGEHKAVGKVIIQ